MLSYELRCREIRPVLGFVYLALLMIVAIFSISSFTLAGYWQTTVKREKEKELLFVGNQYREAIRRYYEYPPLNQAKSYPKNLSDLLLDPRSPVINRCLRMLYAEPMTQKDWGIIRSEEGAIKGVFSTSDEVPIKTQGFSRAYASFENMHSYAEWKFEYVSSSSNGRPNKIGSSDMAGKKLEGVD